MEAKKIEVKEIQNSLNSDLEQYVKFCESEYKNQVKECAKKIMDKNAKFVLLAGPSSSGKTTTSKILSKVFEQNGFNAFYISLDDYFVNREETPLWDDGEMNYETFDSIDWTLFSLCMQGLLNGDAVKLPTYNFLTGCKEFGETTTLQKNSIVVIEGLHALNPIIDKFIPNDKSFKIYISVNTDLYQDDILFLEHNNIRLFRRMIRDLHHRGNSIEETLKTWSKVRLGEKLYIHPFVDTAEYAINSFHPYELSVYKELLKDLVLPEELTQKLLPFYSLDKSVVPSNSVLQEFLPKK